MSQDEIRNDNDNDKDVSDEPLVTRVQQSMQVGYVPSAWLEQLEQKLARVRSWGGAYSEIELSPDIKCEIARQGKVSARALAH